MMRNRVMAVIAVGAGALGVAAWASASASASMMHPRLAARLSGMGEHGTVNLEFTQGSGQVCWLFDLPVVRDVTGTAVLAGLGGTTLFALGMSYGRPGWE